MDLSRTVSEIDSDFIRKSQNFPTPVYFVTPPLGFPLELGSSAGDQKLQWWGYLAEKQV